jgi:hypothetical protein
MSGAAIAAGPLLIQDQGNSAPYGESYKSTTQPFAAVSVGPNDVAITGFGVYGQAPSAMTLKWALFDITGARLYVSPEQNVGGVTNMQWYDSPALNLTLLANHTYALGALTNNATGRFIYSWTYPSALISANGLSLPDMRPQVGNFSNPVLTSPDYYLGQNSIHVFGVPEPAEWVMLIAGLMVVAFIARRRNQMLT